MLCKYSSPFHRLPFHFVDCVLWCSPVCLFLLLSHVLLVYVPVVKMICAALTLLFSSQICYCTFLGIWRSLQLSWSFCQVTFQGVVSFSPSLLTLGSTSTVLIPLLLLSSFLLFYIVMLRYSWHFWRFKFFCQLFSCCSVWVVLHTVFLCVCVLVWEGKCIPLNFCNLALSPLCFYDFFPSANFRYCLFFWHWI